MPPPFLFLRNMNGAAPAVFRYDGATPTQIGGTFGALETDNNEYMGKNRVIQFQNDLYAVQNDGVYKLQGDGTTWNTTGGLAFTNPTTGGSSVYRSGLYPILINRESYLICAYYNTTNNVVIATMDAATNTWSESTYGTSITPDGNNGGFFTEIVFENKFYLGFRNNTTTHITLQYDPVLDNFISLTNPFAAVPEHLSDVCIHNGRLFMGYITTTGAGGRFNLAELSGTQWVDLGRVTAGADNPNTLANREARISLMSDGTNLYYFYPFRPSDTGFRVVEITDVDSLPGSQIQGTVLPSALRSTTDGGTGFAAINPRLIHVPDTQTNPGNPDHYFYFTTDATSGTSLQLYQWNGNSSLMTAIGPTGGDVAHAIPTAGAAGGERIFSDVSADNDILITARETVSGGIQVTFRAYSPSGTDSGTVRIWISTEGEPVTTQAVLSAPVTGGSALLSGNTITGVVADGTTDYTVVVPSGANSFVNLDQVDLVPEFA